MIKLLQIELTKKFMTYTLKATKHHWNKWIPNTWFESLIFLRWKYSSKSLSNAVPIKILAVFFFHRNRQSILKFTLKYNRPR